MLKTMLASKIHRATVTQSDLNYIGSITIDKELLEQIGLIENEQVHVLNLNNGARIVTYVIPGERNSGVIGINGAAAHQFAVGEKVIICAYAHCDETEISKHRPKVLLLDANNKVQSYLTEYAKL